MCPSHEANAHFTAAREILLSIIGVGYPAGNVRLYHRPGKGARDARAKDARDSVSGMHECSIVLSTGRGGVSWHARVQATRGKVSGWFACRYK